MPHSQGRSNIPILSRITPIPSFDTNLFKINSNITFLSTLGLLIALFPVGLDVKMLKPFLPCSILATYPAHFLYLLSMKLSASMISG